MAVRADRGATTVEHNEEKKILENTKELLEDIIKENALEKEDLIDMIFTITPDIDKAFPARAARQLGYTDVPLLDMAEPEIEGALTKCIRIIIHTNTEKKNSDMIPVYLRGAKALRPDLIK